MQEMEKMRTANVFSEDGGKTRVPFMDLKTGDKFKLIESDGTHAHGGQLFEAKSNAYIDDFSKVGTILCDKI